MNAVSVLESFGFCLYFIGAMIDARDFPKICSPRGITLKTTLDVFKSAFPNSSVALSLSAMAKDPGFTRIGTIRNLLAHRLTGRRNIRSYNSASHPGREELQYIPGLNEEVFFDKQLVQRQLDDVTRLLTALTSASLEFVKSKQKSP